MTTQGIEFDVHRVPTRPLVILNMLLMLVLASENCLAAQWPLLNKPLHSAHGRPSRTASTNRSAEQGAAPTLLASGQLAFGPTNGPNAGWVEGIARGSNGTTLVSSKDGIFRSIDNCITWEQVLPSTGYYYPQVEYGTVVAGIESDFYVVGSTDLYPTPSWRYTLSRSSDNGSSWSWQTLYSTDTARLFAVDVTLSGTILIGNNEGVLRSTDHGFTWSHVHPEDSVYSLVVVHPSGSIFGLYYKIAGDSGSVGLIRSTDDGRTWTRQPPLDHRLYWPYQLGADSTGRLLAATTPNGYFSSTDGGVTWQSPGGPLSTEDVVAVAADIGGRIFASTRQALYTSDDRGASWQKLERKVGYSQMYQIVTARDAAFLATNFGLYKTSDEGSHWNYTYPSIGGVNEIESLTFDNEGRLFAGTNAGIHRTTDGGATWSMTSAGYTAYLTKFLVVSKKGTLFAGDNTLFRSADHGDTWNPITLNGAKNVSTVSIDSTGDIFTQTDKGLFRSPDDGNAWHSIPTSDAHGNYPLVFGPDRALYSGSSSAGYEADPREQVMLYKSTDTGTHWQAVLSSGTPGETVTGISFSREGNLLISTSDEYYVSTNGGASWGYPSVDAPTRAGSIAVDAQGDCYAVSSHGVLVRSTDGGMSWSELGSNLGYGSSGTDGLLALDPNGRMYLTWNSSVYKMTSAAMALSRNTVIVQPVATPVYVRISNAGGGTLTWTTTDNVPWLTSDNSRKDTIAVVIQDNSSTLVRTGTVTVNSNAWNSPLTLTIVQASMSSGILAVTVQDADNWGLAGANGNIHLYGANGQLVSTQHTNASSVATFTNVPAGRDYSYTVEYLPSDSAAIFGTLYWGKKTGITVASGQSTQETFIRNAPYAPTMAVFNSRTNVNVTNQLVAIGTSLRIELAVKNPSSMGADSQFVKGRIVLDTNKTLLFEVDMSSPAQKMAVGSASSILFNFTPQFAGTFYSAGALVAKINGVDIYTEGFTRYDRPLFIVADRTLSVKENALPQEFALSQNYPNPFNPSTIIRCALPRETYVSLRVYSPLGQEIRTLIDGTKSAGVYEVRFDGAGLPSGMYIYRMKAGEFVETRRLLLVR